MSVNNLLNFFEESIVGGYSTTDDAIEISDASRLDTFPYSAVIWDIADKSPIEAYKNNRAEIVNITGKTGDVVDVERGQEGTSAITLEAGRNYAIHVAFTADIADQINQAVTDAETAADSAAAEIGSVGGVQIWALSESYTATNIVYDNDSILESADLTWPDGEAGSISDVTTDDFGITSIRYNRPGGKYITIDITRDADGNVTQTTSTATGY